MKRKNSCNQVDFMDPKRNKKKRTDKEISGPCKRTKNI